MAGRISAFEETIRLQLASVQPPEVQKEHASIAMAGLAAHMASANPKPAVTTIVDGRIGAAEESVRAYGVIRYDFSYFDDIAMFAIQKAVELSPVDSGRYRRSWVVYARDVIVPQNAVPAGVRAIVITNTQPYHRKIHIGEDNYSVEPGIVERLRSVVVARFGNMVDAYVRRHHRIPNPYILEGRKRVAGMEMTYPALVIELR